MDYHGQKFNKGFSLRKLMRPITPTCLRPKAKGHERECGENQDKSNNSAPLTLSDNRDHRPAFINKEENAEEDKCTKLIIAHDDVMDVASRPCELMRRQGTLKCPHCKALIQECVYDANESENSALASSDNHEDQFDVENHEENEKCTNDDIRSENSALTSSDNDEDEQQPADHNQEETEERRKLTIVRKDATTQFQPRTITAEDRLRSEEDVKWLWIEHKEKHAVNYAEQYEKTRHFAEIKLAKEVHQECYKIIKNDYVSQIKDEIAKKQERILLKCVNIIACRAKDELSLIDEELRRTAESEMLMSYSSAKLQLLNTLKSTICQKPEPK